MASKQGPALRGGGPGYRNGLAVLEAVPEDVSWLA